MIRLFTITLFASLLLPLSAFAEIKTINHTLKQPFGGSQSPDDARTAGIARAKREALEQFGTYIESATVVKNAQVDSDEILALTAGVTKAEVIKQKNYADGDAFGIEITVKVELDTAVLESSLKRLLEDRNHLKDLKAARERERKLLARIAELEKQNRQKGKTKQETAKLKKEFQAASQGLTAVEWFDKAVALSDGKKYSDPKKAVEYLTQAIRLDTNDALGYLLRGGAYYELKRFDRAIVDFDHSIHLDPNFASTYKFRGHAYAYLNQFDRAIADYDQAIGLDPNDEKTYFNRGMACYELKQFDRAIVDFDRAIRLDPNYTAAYGNRGIIYAELKQFSRAIADFDQVIRLEPNDAKAFYNRGLAYNELKQFDRAIADYVQAIGLDPNDTNAYILRELSYRQLYKTQDGCVDLEKTCKLGVCNEDDTARQEKYCR